MKQALSHYLNRKVVIDTRSSWVYIGTLEQVEDDFIVLSDVDVHDNSLVEATKEFYVLESKKTGIKSNRHRVHINLNFVVSFSGLEEIRNF